MASPPPPEENVRKVLRIYRHFGKVAGDVLVMQNFLAIAAQLELGNEDLLDGLRDGEARGWFVDGSNGSVRLTDTGFEQL